MLKRSFIFNLLLAIAFVIGLLFLFFNSLDWLTNHGKQTRVPNLSGKNMNAAIKVLDQQGFKIQIDSTFISYKNPLEVLFQEPEAGANVKVGRTIFLTVNRKTPPSIDMPNLVNLSFRNAMLVMQSYRLVMGDTIYKPDVAAGSILEQWYKGKPIAAGSKVPFGSTISLVVGEGLYGEVDVPNMIGMSFNEAKNLIQSLQLTYNIMWEGSIDDSAAAIVYMQQPEALNELDFINKMPKGDLVDLRIMQNPSQELLLKNQPGSKKLLGESNAAIDSNEMTIGDGQTSKNIDTSERIRKVPGVNAPNVIPNNSKVKTSAKNEVIGTTKLSQKDYSKKNLPKKNTTTNPKQETIKKSDDNIKNEFE